MEIERNIYNSLIGKDTRFCGLATTFCLVFFFIGVFNLKYYEL